MSNITVTIEKENEKGELTIDSVRLTEVGGHIAHAVTCLHRGFYQNHDNLVIEANKMNIADCKHIKIRQATEQGFVLCEIGGAADLDYPTSQTRRGRVIENGKICPTLTTENIPNVIELGDPKFYHFIYNIEGEWWLIRIRKLTPRECWRLMGFTDEDFDKAEKVNSNTQLYKQAGNSIVVNVLEAIFRQLIMEN